MRLKRKTEKLKRKAVSKRVGGNLFTHATSAAKLQAQNVLKAASKRERGKTCAVAAVERRCCVQTKKCAVFDSTN